MDRDTLDTAYNNSKAIADFPAVLSGFQARSRQLYETMSCRRDLRYGERPRERYDWIPCGQTVAPTYVFMLAEYTLAPDIAITGIVAEIGRLLDHLKADNDGLRIGGLPLCLSGHSAGGHLTAVHRAHPAVSKALAISALVDLEPISLCWLNDKLALTDAEIDDYSPLRHIGEGAPMMIAVGSRELPELVRHSTDYALACESAGEHVGLLHLPGCNHFSVLEDLARADGLQMNVLAAMGSQGERPRSGQPL